MVAVFRDAGGGRTSGAGEDQRAWMTVEECGERAVARDGLQGGAGHELECT
jgi:hypothetical protein